MANLANFIFMTVFFWGRSLRFTNLKWHIRLMLTAMTCDFLLVITLVVFRDAVSKLSPQMHWTLFVHVPIAVTTLILYAIAAYYGYRLWSGVESARSRLRLTDKFLVPLRVLTFLTALMVQFLRA